MEEKSWFKIRFRGFLLDFQMAETEEQTVIGQPANLRNLDVEKICDQLAKAHVNAAYIHAKDNQGNCYYNTKVGHKHKGIGDRDMIAEFIRELHKRDIKALMYVQTSRERRSWQYEEHRARFKDGTPVVRQDTMSLLPSKGKAEVVCLNGPHREYIIAILKELTANYDMDGYWLDGFGWWGSVNPCYCDYCKAKYKEDTGLDIPEEADWRSPVWRVYYEWRKRLNTIVLNELIGTTKSIKPHVTVTHNGAGFGVGVDMEEFCNSEDYLSNEFHSAVGLGDLSLRCKMLRAMGGGKSFEIEIWRFFNASVPRGPQRSYQVKPLEMYMFEMFNVLAHGGIIQFYDQINLDGTLEPRAVDLLEKAYSEVMKREKWLTDAEPVKFAALYWSKYTNDYYGRDDKYANYVSSVHGAHFSMMESHVPFDVVMDTQLNAESLSEYKVLVMPNAVCLSDEQAEAVKAYVKAGGGLVATYRTSLSQKFGQPRPDFALGDVLHASYVEPLTYRYSYVKIMEKHPVTEGVYPDLPLTVWKTLQLKVKPLEGAKVVGNIVYPYRGFQMGNPPMELTDYPAIITSQFGKGRVVYFSGREDAIYADYGQLEHKKLLANAVRWAAGTRALLEVDAPATVEATISGQPKEKRTIIHLLNYTSAGLPQAKVTTIQETVPVHGITVRVSVPKGEDVKRIYLVPEMEEPRYTVKNGYAEIKVPKLDIHGMVVLEF